MAKICAPNRSTVAPMPPDCDKYTETLSRARALIAPDHQAAVVDGLNAYLAGAKGRLFDQTIDREHPDQFTEADIQAVKNLHVHPDKARAWLLGETNDEAAKLLAQVPTDRDIWGVEPDNFDKLLGKGSPAFTLWDEIAALLKGNGHAGRGVAAGKLLAGKRPRLIPIYDHQTVRPELKVTPVNVWEALWCTFRHPDVREHLEAIKAQVPQAESLTLLRVLDIVVWKHHKDHEG